MGLLFQIVPQGAQLHKYFQFHK